MRDPPGDESFASYTNVETTLYLDHQSYDVFQGLTEDVEASIGVDFESK